MTLQKKFLILPLLLFFVLSSYFLYYWHYRVIIFYISNLSKLLQVWLSCILCKKKKKSIFINFKSHTYCLRPIWDTQHFGLKLDIIFFFSITFSSYSKSRLDIIKFWIIIIIVSIEFIFFLLLSNYKK